METVKRSLILMFVVAALLMASPAAQGGLLWYHYETLDDQAFDAGDSWNTAWHEAVGTQTGPGSLNALYLYNDVQTIYGSQNIATINADFIMNYRAQIWCTAGILNATGMNLASEGSTTARLDMTNSAIVDISGALTVGVGSEAHVRVDMNDTNPAVGLTVGSLALGNGTGGLGIMDVLQSKVYVTGTANIGSGGTGVLNLTGGTMTVDNVVNITNADGGTSSVTMSGTSVLDITNGLEIGEHGLATFDISGGDLSAAMMVLGRTGDGTLTVHGSDATINVDSIQMFTGTGTFAFEIDSTGISPIIVAAGMSVSGSTFIEASFDGIIPGPGDEWLVIDSGNAGGNHGLEQIVGDGYGVTWDVEWRNGSTDLYVVGIPEPATLSLLAFGGLAAMIRRRR